MNIVDGFCWEKIVSLIDTAWTRSTSGIQNGGLWTGSTLHRWNGSGYQRNYNG